MEPEATGAMTVRVKSDPRLLAVVRSLIRGYATVAGCDDARRDALVLAVDEGCANAIRHAYADSPEGDIEVTCGLRRGRGGRRLTVEIRDFGACADSSRRRARARSAPTTPGGLGLRLARRLLDAVRLRPAPGGGNVLVMTMRLDAPPGAERPGGAEG